MTTVVNIKREPYDVYIGRAGRGQDGYFGNPFKIGSWDVYQGKRITNREESIESYRLFFERKINTDPEFAERILQLKGKTLGCFCAPLPCHGDVIADYLNNLSP